VIGKNYPQRIVEYFFARQRVWDAYRKGGISPFLKEFLDRSQQIRKILKIENWVLHCWMVLSTHGETAR